MTHSLQTTLAGVQASCALALPRPPAPRRLPARCFKPPRARPAPALSRCCSTSGHSLAGETVATAMIRHLLPLATLLTPNLAEASALLGESVAD
jgi:hypothetical protein